MKKIILVILILCSPIYAADYLDDLVEQRNYVYKNLRLDTAITSVDTGLVDGFIREGYSILAPAIGGRHWTDTVTTVKNQIDYTVDSQLIGIQRVYWHSEDKMKSLDEVPVDSFSVLFPTGISLQGKNGYWARPSYYVWSQSKIKLFPVPFIAGDLIIIDGIARVDSILIDSTFVDEFPVNYRPLPVTYATYRMAVVLDMTAKKADYWTLLQFQAMALNLNIDWGTLYK